MRRFFAGQVGRGIKRSGARGRRRSHPSLVILGRRRSLPFLVILSRMPQAQLSFPCHPEPKAKDLGEGGPVLRLSRDLPPQDRHDRSRTNIPSALPAFSSVGEAKRHGSHTLIFNTIPISCAEAKPFLLMSS